MTSGGQLIFLDNLEWFRYLCVSSTPSHSPPVLNCLKITFQGDKHELPVAKKNYTYIYNLSLGILTLPININLRSPETKTFRIHENILSKYFIRNCLINSAHNG